MSALDGAAMGGCDPDEAENAHLSCHLPAKPVLKFKKTGEGSQNDCLRFDNGCSVHFECHCSNSITTVMIYVIPRLVTFCQFCKIGQRHKDACLQNLKLCLSFAAFSI